MFFYLYHLREQIDFEIVVTFLNFYIFWYLHKKLLDEILIVLHFHFLLEKFYYFKNKRWDIKLYEDLLVKLPRENLYDAIKKLKIFLKNNQTYQFKVVDLRIPNQIIIN